MQGANKPVNPELFISWSGSESYALAVVVSGWLPTVLPGVKPWMSSKDIAKGKRWDAELGNSLERISYCIVCVTPGVAREPWINFEAGAVSKFVQESYVNPLLWHVSVNDLGGLPLAMFQCTQFTKEDVCQLLETINVATGLRIPTERIHKNLDYSWAAFSQRVEQIFVSDDDESQSEESEGGGGGAARQVERDSVAEEILLVVARMDDYPVDVDEVKREVHYTPVATRHHLDRLVAAGYLSKDEEYDSYQLTEDGRAHVVKHGLDLPF